MAPFGDGIKRWKLDEFIIDLINDKIELENMVDMDKNRRGSRDTTAAVELWHLRPVDYKTKTREEFGLASNSDSGVVVYLDDIARITEEGHDKIRVEACKTRISDKKTQCMLVSYFTKSLGSIEEHLKKEGNIVLMVGRNYEDVHKLSAFVNVGNGIIEQYKTFEYNPRKK